MPSFNEFSTARPSFGHWLHSIVRRVRLRPKHVLPPRSSCGRVDLPDLPFELWMLIFREATAMSTDPLDVSHGVSFLDSSLSSRLGDNLHTMFIKCNLSLVSKKWNRLAQEFLYEFVWINRADQAKALARTLLEQGLVQGRGKETSGRFIRRLHIETPFLKRCAPADIRTILDYATQLIIYSDHQSVRRNCIGGADPRCSPAEMFSALAHPNNKLRRLSWTNYDDVPFHFHMSPILQKFTSDLEYLELCSPAQSYECPIYLDSAHITLPALRSLKVTLDNVTFAVLASWDMPQLVNLSIVSCDFNYAGDGISSFLHTHGPKLLQLELGHSSSLIEEHTLTPLPYAPLSLAKSCPNLRQFICSADAEWNWQTPDWIAPHVLLPAHPRLEFIGIRDIDRRLANAAPAFFPLLAQLASLLHREAFPELRFIRDLSPASFYMRHAALPEEVVRFWAQVLDRCDERQVWWEDCRGVNITRQDLRRATHKLIAS